MYEIYSPLKQRLEYLLFKYVNFCFRVKRTSLHDEASAELQKQVRHDVLHYDCPSSLPLDNSAINQRYRQLLL